MPAPWREPGSRRCRPFPPPRRSSSPPALRAKPIVWDETLAAGGYAARTLDRGARLRLVDLHGDACVSMLMFNAEGRSSGSTSPIRQGPVERLSGRRPVAALRHGPGDDQPGRGQRRRARRVLRRLERASNARRYGDGFNHGAHPNARDRLRSPWPNSGSAARTSIPASTSSKPVRIAADGATELDVGPFPPAGLTLRAEMDVIVVLANCPHVLDPRRDIQRHAAAGPRLARCSDARGRSVRNATPEGQRAFQNLEEYYRR